MPASAPLQLLGQSCTTATCTAASVAESDVTAALPASGNTNSTVTVNIPSGTGLWTSQLTYTVPAAVTNLIIQGNTTVSCSGTPGASTFSCTATDNTIIQDNIAGGFGVWQFFGSASTNPLLRVTGITIQGGTGAVKGQGLLLYYSQSSAGSQIRFDHDHFNATTSGNGAWAGAVNGCTTGVIDHNVFDNASTSDTGSVVQGFMAANTCNDSLGYGDGSWAYATGFGTSNFLFMENNVFNGGLEGDCESGGKFVSRYNTLNSSSQSSSWIHDHGTEQNGGRVRGCRAYEAYNNYFNIVSGSGSVMFGGDGGTSMVWGNTLNKTTALFSGYGDERNDGQHHQVGTPSGWGFCGTSTIDPNTGLANGVGSAWDGNSNAGTGWPCLDGLGRGQGTQALNGANFPSALNSTTGTIAWPHEYLEPIYQWMNTLAGTPQVTIGGSAAIQNRDVFVDNGAFTGATGTGFGLAASRPATCTPGPGGTYGASPGGGSYGIAYWETDNQQLDVCTATNTWTAGVYKPYTYPYPSTGSGVSLTVTLTGGGTASASGTNCGFGSGSYTSGTTVGTCTYTATGGSTITSVVGTGSASCSGTTCSSFSLTVPSTITVATTGGTPTCGDPTENGPNYGGTYLVPPTPLPLGVSWSSPTAGCGMHATFDGSAPTCASASYGGSSSLTATTLIRVIACQGGYTSSAVVGDEWTITIVSPTFSPVAGSYSSAQSVAISNGGSAIHYTVDGSTPTTSSPLYTHPIRVSQSQTLKAIAAAGTGSSSVVTAAYTITPRKTRFSLSTTSASVSPVPFPQDSRACCGTNVASLEATRGTFTLTPLHNFIAQAVSNGSTFWYTIQGFPTWMTGLGSVESAPPTDLTTVAACQNVLSGTTTTDCSMKEFVTEIMIDRTGLSSQPSTPVSCTNLDYIEPINELNTDSVGPSSTGWTGTYAQLAILMNDISSVAHAWCSNTVVIGGSVSGIVGFHSNGADGHFDVALETVLSDWAGISGASLPDAVSFHAYPARGTVAPVPFPTTIVSNSDTACTSGNTPNVSCYIAVDAEATQIQGSAVLQNAAIAPWAKNLDVLSTEGGFGTLSQLCSLTSGTTLCQGYVSEYMAAIAAQNVPVAMLYAANDATWGCYWDCGSGDSAWLQSFDQTNTWLNTYAVTNPGAGLTSTSVTGGKKWTLALGSGAAEISWCDAWLATCTASTSFAYSQTLTGVITLTGGTVTLSQSPVLLSNVAPGPPPPVAVNANITLTSGVKIK